MKKLITIILFFTIGIIYGQTDNEFMIIGQSNTEPCNGVAKPVFIKNLYTAISIKVKYRRVESNRTDLIKETNVLAPSQQVRIGCEVNEGGFERKFEIISIVKGVDVFEETTQENKEQILNGTNFKVMLNGTNCPSDSGWTGNGDPLGTLLCGETYSGNYSNGKFTFTGYHERTRRNETHTYSNASPNNYELTIWGVKLKFNEKNEILHPSYGLIGTISFN